MCKSVTGQVDVDKIGIKKRGKFIGKEIAEETRKWSSSCTCDKVQPNTQGPSDIGCSKFTFKLPITIQITSPTAARRPGWTQLITCP